MSHYSSDIERFNGLTDGDAYRSYLISRNQGPIVYHSGEMHMKRLRVVLRHAGSHIRSLLASTHLAFVAARVRRVRFQYAWRLTHDHKDIRTRKANGVEL